MPRKVLGVTLVLIDFDDEGQGEGTAVSWMGPGDDAAKWTEVRGLLEYALGEPYAESVMPKASAEAVQAMGWPGSAHLISEDS